MVIWMKIEGNLWTRAEDGRLGEDGEDRDRFLERRLKYIFWTKPEVDLWDERRGDFLDEGYV